MKIFENPELLKASLKSASNPPSLAANSKKKNIIGFLFKEKENEINGGSSLNKSKEIHRELIGQDQSSKLFRSQNFVFQPNERNIEGNSINSEEKDNKMEKMEILLENPKENNETIDNIVDNSKENNENSESLSEENIEKISEKSMNSENKIEETIIQEKNAAEENSIGFLSLSEKIEMAEKQSGFFFLLNIFF